MYSFSPFLYTNNDLTGRPLLPKHSAFVIDFGQVISFTSSPQTVHINISGGIAGHQVDILSVSGELRIFRYGPDGYDKPPHETVRHNVCRIVPTGPSSFTYVDTNGQALLIPDVYHEKAVARFECHWNIGRPPSLLIGNVGIAMAMLPDGNFIARPPHSHCFEYPALDSLAKYYWRPITKLNDMRDGLLFQCLVGPRSYGSLIILCNQEKTRSRLIMWGGDDPQIYPEMTIIYDTADADDELVFLYAYATRNVIYLLTINHCIYMKHNLGINHVLDLPGPPELIVVHCNQSMIVFMPNGQRYDIDAKLKVVPSVGLPVRHPSPMAWLVPEETRAWWSVWVRSRNNGGILGLMPREIARLIAEWIWIRPHPPRGLCVEQMPAVV